MKNIIVRSALCLCMTITLIGCGLPYRIDVEQGNIIEQETLNRLSVGMTKNQVQQILGSALLQDVFHRNRWDYVQLYKNGKTQTVEKSLISLFYTNGLLRKIEKHRYTDIKTEPLPYSAVPR